MASKVVLSVILFLVLVSTQAEGNNNLVMASRTLSDKGYQVMSMIFQVFLNDLNVSELLTGNSTLTVFSPQDGAFYSSKYTQPPLTLLQYHVVPSKLDGEALQSLHHGSKIDTLLLGHPLVVTTLPTDEYTSLNGVTVTESNIYNDGGLIVHGVDNFFDPAFQTLIYPWYDVKKDIHNEASNRKEQQLQLGNGIKNLYDKGYHALSSIILDALFKNHMNVSGNSTFTVLCPPDGAFSSKNPQPPLELLQYHVVPQELESGNLSSLPHGSKIDTLLPGHPLVATTLPNDNYTSLNEVKVTQWNLYNDGGLIIHATHDVSEWLSGNSTLTVFCPPDDVFFSSKYPQPPLTLLQYHVVPLKLESGDLSSLPHGSKVNTLLFGHSLVATTPQSDEYPISLNEVKALYILGSIWFDMVRYEERRYPLRGSKWIFLGDNRIDRLLVFAISNGCDWFGYYVCCDKDDGNESILDHVLDVKPVYLW
ncbi:hypothetical protein FEM48_Zijuj01G0242000 [Ziziphus jujuba var. spinosa]|uniref:FAS1 domain-containing protein n=1 Tax=Ziziphus jujuba var. spinosa TaxID=714518 RepID=A0A978W4E0_ZIZJJ|nr:hypothetical protein FEM48_Zijuj01G0242000 [Ziziphus jujuba var. spinosa]